MNMCACVDTNTYGKKEAPWKGPYGEKLRPLDIRVDLPFTGAHPDVDTDTIAPECIQAQAPADRTVI